MSRPLYNTALKFSSGRYKMRSGYMPLSVGLALAYCFVVLWLVVSVNMLPLNMPFVRFDIVQHSHFWDFGHGYEPVHHQGYAEVLQSRSKRD
jgi:hypothetical protein